MNKYTGEYPIDINGQKLTLVYDYEALARIRSELGGEGQTKALNGDTPSLTLLISIGLSKKHPEWTPEKVSDASPFIIPAIKAIQEALLIAHFGPDGLPKDKKQNPLRPPLILLQRLWGRLFGRI